MNEFHKINVEQKARHKRIHTYYSFLKSTITYGMRHKKSS